METERVAVRERREYERVEAQEEIEPRHGKRRDFRNSQLRKKELA